MWIGGELTKIQAGYGLSVHGKLTYREILGKLHGKLTCRGSGLPLGGELANIQGVLGCHDVGCQ